MCWIIYYYLKRTSTAKIHSHLKTSISRDTVTFILKIFYQRIELDEILNMILHPHIPGHLEADETWAKVGTKYPGRGRWVDVNDSMV